MTVSERKKMLEAYAGRNRCPADFDKYWKKRYGEILISSIRRQPVPFMNSCAVYEELTVRTGEGRESSARYIRPRGEGPFPVLFLFHDLGRPVRGWHHMTRFTALGWSVIALENPSELKTEDLQGQTLENLYLDALAIVKAAQLLPETGKILSTWGEGFGGGLAIVTAALLGGDTRCACLNPMPAEIQEEYLDIANFSRMLTGQLLMGTGLMDTISRPEGQYAVYNPAHCQKWHFVYPKYAHERINDFENEHIKFLNLWQQESGV